MPAQDLAQNREAAARDAGRDAGRDVGRDAVPAQRAIPSGVLAVAALRLTGEQLARLPDGEFAPLLEVCSQSPLLEAPRQLLAAAGLPAERWQSLLTRGVSATWIGVTAKGPDWMIAVDVGDEAEVFAQALERLALEVCDRGWQVRSELFDKTPLHELKHDSGFALHCAVRGGLLVVAPFQQTLEQALRRAETRGSPSLLDDPGMRELTTWATEQGPPPFTVMLRPAEIVRAHRRRVPVGSEAGAVFEALDLNRVTGVGIVCRPHGKELGLAARVLLPAPRSGLLSALFGGSSKVARGAARFAPEGIESFTAGRVSASGIAHSVIALVGQSNPELQDASNSWLRRMKSSTGVDLDADLLAPLGEQVAVIRWPASAEGTQDWAILVDVRDAWRLRKSFDQLLGSAVLPASSTTIGNYRADFLLKNELGLRPGVCVTETHLVLTNSQKAMESTLAQLAPSQGGNAAVARCFAEADPEATWISCTDLHAAGKSGLALLPESNPEIRRIARRLAELTTERGGLERAWVRADAQGLQLESRSPIGNLTLLLRALTELERALGPQVETRSLTGAPAEERVVALIAQIAAAERAQREAKHRDADSDGTGEYLELRELLAAGGLAPEPFTDEAKDGSFASLGHRVAVLLPDDPDQRENHFAVVAWPEQARIGRAFAVTDRHPGLANDLIAGARGLTRMSPLDVFQDGDFGGTLATGWRETQVQGKGEPGKPAPTADAFEQELCKRIIAAEQGKPGRAPAEVVDALRAANPAIAARAAHALGVLKAVESVPELCTLAQSATDTELRRQAMGALLRIKDPRSVTASIVAVGSEDAQLRTLAARNLGQLRAREGTPGLLGVATAARETPATDRSDRVQALLALTDIGEASVVRPLSVALKDANAEEAQALAYLFEKLSPQLQRTEESLVLITLLDHPGTVVRRYAIQRLTELRDPASVRALEGHLGQEGDALRPLVEVALRTIRGGDGATETTSSNELVEKLKRYAQMLHAKWLELEPKHRGVAVASLAGVTVLCLGLLLVGRRARRGQRARVVADLTRPSEEYLARHRDDEPDPPRPLKPKFARSR